MSERTMHERVGNLEKLAETLAPLPGQVSQLDDRVADVESRLGNVESQVVQLRTEMADEFSAVRAELRAEMADGFAATLLVVESSSKATQTMFDQAHRIIREGDEETRRQMHVLHEDLVKRIAGRR